MATLRDFVKGFSVVCRLDSGAFPVVARLLTMLLLCACQQGAELPQRSVIPPVLSSQESALPQVPGGSLPPGLVGSSAGLYRELLQDPSSPEFPVFVEPGRADWVIDEIFGSITAYDEQGRPVEGALVRVSTMREDLPFERSAMTDAAGLASFSELWAGVQLVFTVSKPGYSSRRSTEVLKSNRGSICNCYAFGLGPKPDYFDNYGVAFNALSRRPEVSRVVPERTSMLAVAGGPIILGFSRPMQAESVEDDIQIRVVTGSHLSVDDSVSFKGASDAEHHNGELLFDRQAFDISWNADHTEMILRFRPGWQLPVDRDFTRTPIYRLSLDGGDGLIRSQDGFERSGAVFKLTEGDFETGYEFIPQADLTSPSLESAVATRTGSQGLVLKFSEAMRIRTLAGLIGAGMKAANEAPAGFDEQGVSAQAAAENYKVTSKRNGRLILDHVSWASLAGRAGFDPDDPAFRTVRLDLGLTDDFDRLLQPGDEVTIEVAGTVRDPAGNHMDETRRRFSLVLN